MRQICYKVTSSIPGLADFCLLLEENFLLAVPCRSLFSRKRKCKRGLLAEREVLRVKWRLKLLGCRTLGNDDDGTNGAVKNDGWQVKLRLKPSKRGCQMGFYQAKIDLNASNWPFCVADD